MKTKLVGVFTVLVLFLTTFQGVLPTLPITNQSTITIISAIVLYLSTALTIWKQLLSKQIDSNAIWPTVIVGLVATFAGLTDVLKVIPFTPFAAQLTRFIITFIVLFLNMISKVWYSTNETHSVI